MKYRVAGILLLTVVASQAIQATVLFDVPKTNVQLTRVRTDPSEHHYIVSIDRLDEIYSPQLALDLSTLRPALAVDWLATRLVKIDVDVVIHDNGDVLLDGKRLRDGVQKVTMSKMTVVNPKVADDVMLDLGVRSLLETMRIAQVEVDAQITTVEIAKVNPNDPAAANEDGEMFDCGGGGDGEDDSDSASHVTDGAEMAMTTTTPQMRIITLRQRIVTAEGVQLTQKEFVEQILEIHPDGQVVHHEPCVVPEGEAELDIANDGHQHLVTLKTKPSTTITSAAANSWSEALRQNMSATLGGDWWSRLSPFLRVAILSALASFATITAIITLPMLVYYLYAAWGRRRTAARGYRHTESIDHEHDDDDDAMVGSLAKAAEAKSERADGPPAYHQIVIASADSTSAKDPNSLGEDENSPLTH
ncbi:hypothetical protein BJ085DRAFT_30239 [Dimargaris cristalligena]|uniref:Uncharacterized protein n=1 Tax=Dimargaris cristalligena TaxID=215637 RepID=A0A4Q0A5D8_9FUNG|nr:hypothetical protein BJ085DRAFT_30239 [Dimargaris cristalligena]|eukprot:RKP40450.1 hypothetical protein BJ085DRAFT_30239 [Dimargaris cristalligena]